MVREKHRPTSSRDLPITTSLEPQLETNKKNLYPRERSDILLTISTTPYTPAFEETPEVSSVPGHNRLQGTPQGDEER